MAVDSIESSPDNVVTGINVDVERVFAAAAGIRHIISAIIFSYSDTPTGGRLTVEDGAAVVFDIDITAKGAGRVPFEPPLRGTINTALTITLYDGGAAVVGKLNVPGHLTQG
jgi:hypothetical protein